MHESTIRRARAFVPVLVIVLAALLVVLGGQFVERPAALPTDDASTAERSPLGAEAAAPVLLGRRDAAISKPSRLTHGDLKQLVVSRVTAWEVARQIVAEGEVAVPVLIVALGSGDEDVARGAIRALLLIPRPAVPALAAALEATEGTTRTRVLEALYFLSGWWAVHEAGAAVVPRLATLLSTGDEKERRTCAQLIGRAGRHAGLGLEAIAEALDSAEGEELEHLAFHASRLGTQGSSLGPIVLRRLLESLEEVPDDDERYSALIRALGRLGPHAPEDVARLAASIATAPPSRRSGLCWWLADRGESATGALPDLERLLADPDARRGATYALIRIPGGAMAAARHLVGRATRPVDRNHELRWLSELGPRFVEVLPWLVDAARTGEGVTREAAVRALGYAPPEYLERVAAVLESSVRSPDENVRRAAAWAALWREDPFPGEDTLVRRALEDPCAGVRHVALLWFRRRSKDSRNEAHAALVAPLLGSPDPKNRFWAGNVLEDIGTAPASALENARRNLLHEDRLVRVGASRALATLGPKAADAVPEMIETLLDTSRETFGLGPLAKTGVFDERVKDALRLYMAQETFGAGSVLRCFEERAAVFEPELREHFLANPRCGDLYLLAQVTTDPEGFADWLLTHRARFRERDVLSALRSLDAAGLPTLLEETLEGTHRAASYARSASRALGTEALPALLDAARAAEGEDRATILELLTTAAPEGAAPAFRQELSSESAPTRAAAALGLAAAFGGGMDSSRDFPALTRRLDDEDPAVRDAAWQAMVAARRPSDALLARAEEALGDSEARVRVAAAEAVIAFGGDTTRAMGELQAVLNVPAPTWGWIGGGGTGARTESGYSPTETLWTRAGRTLERLGEAAAPAAETVVWAAMRHGEPLMQTILLGSVAAMGKAAEPVFPLLDRLARTRGTWLGFHETRDDLDDRLKAIYAPFGRVLPEPGEDGFD